MPPALSAASGCSTASPCVRYVARPSFWRLGNLLNRVAQFSNETRGSHGAALAVPLNGSFSLLISLGVKAYPTRHPRPG